MSAEGVAEQGGGAVEAALAFAESQPEVTRRRELVWQDPLPKAEYAPIDAKDADVRDAG